MSTKKLMLHKKNVSCRKTRLLLATQKKFYIQESYYSRKARDSYLINRLGSGKKRSHFKILCFFSHAAMTRAEHHKVIYPPYSRNCQVLQEKTGNKINKKYYYSLELKGCGHYSLLVDIFGHSNF